MIIFSGLGRVRSFNFPDPAMGVAPTISQYKTSQRDPARNALVATRNTTVWKSERANIFAQERGSSMDETTVGLASHTGGKGGATIVGILLILAGLLAIALTPLIRG